MQELVQSSSGRGGGARLHDQNRMSSLSSSSGFVECIWQGTKYGCAAVCVLLEQEFSVFNLG